MNRLFIGFVLFLFPIFSVEPASITIDNYPTEVEAGTFAEITVSWENLDTDGSHKIFAGFENLSVDPEIRASEEIQKFNKNESGKKIKIQIPYNTQSAAGGKFVVALISKTEEWSDVPALADTQTVVSTVASTIEIETLSASGSEYARFVPEGAGYTASTPNGMIVALHGSSDDGPNFIKRWVDAGIRHQMIVIAPSSETSEEWQDSDWSGIQKAINQTMNFYNVDPNYIMLTGFSAGGIACFKFGLAHSDVFRAIVPMAGFPRELVDQLALSESKDQQLPIRIINGDKDSNFSLVQFENVVSFLHHKGFVVKSILKENTGHSFTMDDTIKAVNWFKKNMAPIVGQPAHQVVTLGESVDLNLSAIDKDNNLSKFKVKNLPDGAVFNKETGQLTWTPTVGQIGSYFIKVLAKDSESKRTKRYLLIYVQTDGFDDPFSIHSSVVKAENFKNRSLGSFINDGIAKWKITKRKKILIGVGRSGTDADDNTVENSYLTLPDLKTPESSLTIKFKVKVSPDSNNSGVVLFDIPLILSNQKIEYEGQEYYGLSADSFHDVLLKLISIDEDEFTLTLKVDDENVFQNAPKSDGFTDKFFAFWVHADTRKISFKDLIIFQDS